MHLRKSFSNSLRSRSTSSRHLLASSYEDMDKVVMGDEPKSSEQEKQESFDVLDNVAAEEESHDGDTRWHPPPRYTDTPSGRAIQTRHGAGSLFYGHS